MTDTDYGGAAAPMPLAGAQVAARLHGVAVALPEFAAAEHDGAADTGRDDGVVVAVDHAPQAAVERHLFLVVAVHRVVEAGGVDHDEVRPVALPQRAGVDAEPLGQLAGQPVHRALHGQERRAGPVGVAGALEHLEREVVERHVAQVGARVGEAHVDARLGGELVELLGPVIRHDRRPPDVALAVLDEHVEERVERVQSALVGDRPEALAHQRLIRAFDDDGVVEVAVPQRRPQLDAVELAPEPPPVVLVGQQLIALQLVAQVQGRGARAELLEDRQVDAVGVQLEGHRQVLEPHRRAQDLVQQPGAEAEGVHGQRHRLGVGRHQQAHPNSLAPPQHPAAGQKEQQPGLRVLDVRSALQDAAALAQHLDQPAPLAPGGEGGRQRARTEPVAVELVDRRVHAGHAQHPGVERLVEQCGHPLQFGVGGLNGRVGGAVEPQHRGAQIRMTD
jgi:hypothetical protein